MRGDCKYGKSPCGQRQGQKAGINIAKAPPIDPSANATMGLVSFTARERASSLPISTKLPVTCAVNSPNSAMKPTGIRPRSLEADRHDGVPPEGPRAQRNQFTSRTDFQLSHSSARDDWADTHACCSSLLAEYGCRVLQVLPDIAPRERHSRSDGRLDAVR